MDESIYIENNEQQGTQMQRATEIRKTTLCFEVVQAALGPKTADLTRARPHRNDITRALSD